MTTTKRTKIMSVFADEAQAQQAMNDLQRAGIWPEQIRYSVHRGGGGITNSLEQLGLPEQEVDFYNREFEAGHTIVMVDAPDRQQEVYEMLSRYGGYDFNLHAAQMGGSTSTAPTDTEGEQRLKLREEKLNIQKQPVETGGVRMRKDVVSEQQSVDVPVTHEEVYIERRPGSGQPSDRPIEGGKVFRKLDQLLLPASLIQFALFVPVAWWTRRHPQPPVEIVFTRMLQHNQPSLMRRIVLVVSTLLGSAVFLNVLAVPTAVIFWRRNMRLEALMTVGISWSNALVRTLIKQVVHRPRPNPLLVRRTKLARGKSFPSGHVASALTFWGWLFALGMLHLRGKGSWQKGLLSLPVLFLMLVGPSRIYLGEHWATDVLGGYLFGGGWLGLALRLYLTSSNKRIPATN